MLPADLPLDPVATCLQIAARRGAALRLAGLLLDGAVAVERAQAQHVADLQVCDAPDPIGARRARARLAEAQNAEHTRGTNVS